MTISEDGGITRVQFTCFYLFFTPILCIVTKKGKVVGYKGLKKRTKFIQEYLIQEFFC